MKRNLLLIAPPYPLNFPPAGAAALMGYLKANDCHDFDFIDFRLWQPYAYAPTYKVVGTFGESFVIDIPDLPLVLQILRNFRENKPLISELNETVEDYCHLRQIRPQELHSYLHGVDRFFQNVSLTLKESRFVGFTTWTSNFLPTLIAACHLKRQNPDIFIVAGGPQVSLSMASAKIGLRAGLFDAVVQGEGEQALLQLYREFDTSGNGVAKPIPGVMRAENISKDSCVEKRKLLSLPELPVPSFQEMDVMAYQAGDWGKKVLPFELTRGCTDKCNFCAEWVLWQHFRSDDPSHAVGQLLQLKEEYRTDSFVFMDSLLNGHMPRLKGFVDELLRFNAKIRFAGNMRADMDDETAKQLKRAGFWFAFIGVESLEDKTLELMNKRRTEADNIRSIETFCRHGITVVCGFIGGFPGDTPKGVIRTGKVIRRLQDKYPGLIHTHVAPFQVYAGQPIYKNPADFNLIAQNWSEEILDIDPYFREITEDINYSVTGPNQGVDRMGSTYMARALTDQADAMGDPELAKKRREHIPFLYTEKEAYTGRKMSFRPLSPGWFLGCSKTPTALVYALIFTTEEKEHFERLYVLERGRNHLDFHKKSIFDWESLSNYLSEIEDKHLIAPEQDVPKIVTGHYCSEIKNEDKFTFSPFVVVRENDDGDKLLCVNFVTGHQFEISSSLSPIFSFLAEKPRNHQGLQKFMDEEEIEVDYKALQKILFNYHDLGLLTVASAVKREEDTKEQDQAISLPTIASAKG